MSIPSPIVLAAEEQTQLERSLVLLGDSIGLLADLEQVYDLLPESHTFQSPLSHEDGVRINMLMFCRRNLTVGILTDGRMFGAWVMTELRIVAEDLFVSVFSSEGTSLQRNSLSINVIAESKAANSNTILPVIA